MALVVEDGTFVANADSYISLADARTYATSRGLTLNADNTTAELQLRKAFDYLEGKRGWKGSAVDPAQLTQWPRTYVYVNGVELNSAIIPTKLKYAQVHLAAAIESGLDLTPTSAGDAFIIREKVGPLETEYAGGSAIPSGVPSVRIVDSLLVDLLEYSGGLVSVRA